MRQGEGKAKRGSIISIRGSAMDASFPGKLPAIYNLLRTGEGGKIRVGMITRLDTRRIRGVALTPTQGLALGAWAEDRGISIQRLKEREISK